MTSLALVVALTLALAGCAGQKASQSANAGPAKEYQLHGRILGLDASGHVATIQHDAIPGFMGAMTMGYPVKDQAEFSKLTAGETIDATVYVQGDDMWVGKIRKSEKQP